MATAGIGGVPTAYKTNDITISAGSAVVYTCPANTIAYVKFDGPSPSGALTAVIQAFVDGLWQQTNLVEFWGGSSLKTGESLPVMFPSERILLTNSSGVHVTRLSILEVSQ